MKLFQKTAFGYLIAVYYSECWVDGDKPIRIKFEKFEHGYFAVLLSIAVKLAKLPR